MKRVCLVLVCLASVGAHASYEFMAVINNTKKSVDRYDPETGAFLGRIGEGILVNPNEIIYTAQNRILVGDNFLTGLHTLYEFDASTGSVVRQFYNQTPWDLMGMAKIGNTLYATDFLGGTNTRLSSYNLTTGAWNGVIGITFPSAVAWGLWSYGGQLWGGDSAGRVGTINTTTGVFNEVYFGVVGQVTCGTTMTGLSFAGTSTGGVVVNNSTSYLGSFGSGLTSVAGIAAGHTMMYASGSVAGGGSAIKRMSPITQITTGTIISTPDALGQIAVWNAPEPGTWLALGLGGLAVVRRRRA